MTLILDTCRPYPSLQFLALIENLEFPILFIQPALCGIKGIEIILRTQRGVKPANATTSGLH